MSDYYVGLACMNGHSLSGLVGSEFLKSVDEFCPQCGEPTISKCPECQADIRGTYKESLSAKAWKVARHCHSCGKPYPWTLRNMEALSEAIAELDGLTGEERQKLTQSIPDIVAQTPKSETAALRFKKAAAKVGSASGKVLMSVLTNVAAEGVKRLLGV